jgi:Flp pilus assembly protein TadG
MIFTPKDSLGFLDDERGATLIEMAVVIPVLLSIGLGALEFGNLYYNHHLITNGVRDAARYAAGLVGDVCNDAALQTDIADIARINGSSSGVWPAGSTITVSCIQHDNAGNIYRGEEYVYTVRVTATVPYQSLGLLGYFGLAAPTLTVSHQERVIGVR